METTVTNEHTYETIGFGGAVIRQFRLLWTSRRPLLMLVALLAIMVLAGEPWTDDSKMRLLTIWPVWLIFIGPIWAFAVFHNEGPDNRLYFWTHPTDRAAHSLARITAGLAWLWVMFLALIGAGWVLGLVDGDAWQMAEIGIAGWVNFFTGPLLGYLVLSVLTIPSNYPIRWTVGILFFFPLTVSLFTEWLDLEELLETVLKPLIHEDWGLGVTLIGGLGRDVSRLEHTLRVLRDPSYTGSSHFDAAELWWTATPLWALLFAAMVVFIATRHPDTLPRWRGFRRRDG